MSNPAEMTPAGASRKVLDQDSQRNKRHYLGDHTFGSSMQRWSEDEHLGDTAKVTGCFRPARKLFGNEKWAISDKFMVGVDPDNPPIYRRASLAQMLNDPEGEWHYSKADQNRGTEGPPTAESRFGVRRAVHPFKPKSVLELGITYPVRDGDTSRGDPSQMFPGRSAHRVKGPIRGEWSERDMAHRADIVDVSRPGRRPAASIAQLESEEFGSNLKDMHQTGRAPYATEVDEDLGDQFRLRLRHRASMERHETGYVRRDTAAGRSAASRGRPNSGRPHIQRMSEPQYEEDDSELEDEEEADYDEEEDAFEGSRR